MQAIQPQIQQQFQNYSQVQTTYEPAQSLPVPSPDLQYQENMQLEDILPEPEK